MSQNFYTYEEAKTYAVKQVREIRVAYGIEKALGPLQKGYNVIMLPRPENRCGHELRCEALEPEHYPPIVKKD